MPPAATNISTRPAKLLVPIATTTTTTITQPFHMKTPHHTPNTCHIPPPDRGGTMHLLASIHDSPSLVHPTCLTRDLVKSTFPNSTTAACLPFVDDTHLSCLCTVTASITSYAQLPAGQPLAKLDTSPHSSVKGLIVAALQQRPPSNSAHPDHPIPYQSPCCWSMTLTQEHIDEVSGKHTIIPATLSP
eukprot:jgi/Psemu1/52012/gm1.52012_g